MNTLKMCATAWVLCAGSAAALSAATYNATGTGNWNDSAVWVNGTIPPAGVTAGNNIYMYGGATVSVDSTINVGSRLTVGNASGPATLRLTTGANLAVTDRIYAGDRSGTNMSAIFIEGGTLHAKGGANGNILAIGDAQSISGAIGQMGVSGDGRLLFDGNTITFRMASNNATATTSAAGTPSGGAVGTLNQTGGIIRGTAYMQIATSAYVDSGYSLSANISLTGGTFSLSGSAANANAFGNNALASGAHVAMTVSSNMDSVYLGNNTNFSGNDTTLILDLAQLSSWTGKTVMQFGGALTINGAAGVIVDLSDFGLWDGANVGDTVTITLLSYNSLSKSTSTADTITGLDADHFSAGNIIWGANAATIDVTYTNAIPEPAVAAGALGLLALAMAVRRRRN